MFSLNNPLQFPASRNMQMLLCEGLSKNQQLISLSVSMSSTDDYRLMQVALNLPMLLKFTLKVAVPF